MKEKPAAALLASHLLDPADTEADVMAAAAALAVVAGPNEEPALRQFFGMYRATAPDDDMAAAVVSAGEALTTSTTGRARGGGDRRHDRVVREGAAAGPGRLDARAGRGPGAERRQVEEEVGALARNSRSRSRFHPGGVHACQRHGTATVRKRFSRSPRAAPHRGRPRWA